LRRLVLRLARLLGLLRLLCLGHFETARHLDALVALALAVEIVAGIARLLLLLQRLLGERGGDDAVVVLGVLEIVLRHHPVAGALRVAGERGVFLGHLLSRAANLHVRAVALVAAGQRIGAAAVLILIIVVVA